MEEMRTAENLTLTVLAMDNLTSVLEELRSMAETSRDNLNDFFFLTCTILIFAMQAGFSLMEAGLVRSKNVTHVLLESTIDAFIGASVYWLFGYAFCWGEGNDFIGWTGFALSNVPKSRYSFWLYQLIFANTASTITSGSVAERLHTTAFFFYSCLLTGFMYPVACRWIWSDNGWLKRLGAFDDSGSGIVHMLGGSCALAAILVLGPRLGRFSKDNKEPTTEMSGHSMTITAIGGYLLTFGFLGYNMSTPGRLKLAGDGSSAALSTVNTLMAGAAGAIASLFLAKFTPMCHKKWSYLEMLNGSIAGLVASCAGCNIMPTWGAYLTGMIGGCVFMNLRLLTHKLKIDDVLDAFPVHFGGGITGMLATPFFMYDGILLKGDSRSGMLLGYQVIAVIVLTAWGFGFTSALFLLLNKAGILRASVEAETIGLDETECGEPAYPASAWEEEQYLAYHKQRTIQLFDFLKENNQSLSYPRLRNPAFMNGDKKTNVMYLTIREADESAFNTTTPL